MCSRNVPLSRERKIRRTNASLSFEGRMMCTGVPYRDQQRTMSEQTLRRCAYTKVRTHKHTCIAPIK